MFFKPFGDRVPFVFFRSRWQWLLTVVPIFFHYSVTGRSFPSVPAFYFALKRRILVSGFCATFAETLFILTWLPFSMVRHLSVGSLFFPLCLLEQLRPIIVVPRPPVLPFFSVSCRFRIIFFDRPDGGHLPSPFFKIIPACLFFQFFNFQCLVLVDAFHPFTRGFFPQTIVFALPARISGTDKGRQKFLYCGYFYSPLSSSFSPLASMPLNFPS